MMIVQALVTALLAGLFSGVMLFALNERRDRQRLLLEKTELAVEAYSAWVHSLQKWIIGHLDMFLDDRHESRTMIFAEWNDLNLEFARARILIGIYLPERLDVLDMVSARYIDFMELRKSIIDASIAGAHASDEHSKIVVDTHKGVAEASTNGLTMLVMTAGQHARSPFLIARPNIRWRQMKP